MAISKRVPTLAAIEQIPDPPADLSPRSQETWKEVVPSRGRSAERLISIHECLKVRDQADRLGELLKEQGLVCESKKTGLVHVNPLLKAQKDFMTLFNRTWLSLGLSWNARIDGRNFD